ncbi:MAG TPA: ROK family protein, partial [Candidatus Ozemobacteraceae bacterium]|nr:ROK family protein [Candidatus Ozemobacteraceae bacterium]
FGCPVFVGNDVDVGTFGEYSFGAGKGGRCVLGVFPGTGIGGGCVYEGNLLRGKTGSILEIGHIQVQRDGPQCGCGRRGCIEAIASRLAIARECAAAAFRGEAPHLYAEAGTDLEKIRSKTLMRAIEEGDTVIERIVRRAARQLGRAIASAVNLLGPDIVVLGGGLVEAMPKLYLAEVESAIRAEAMKAYTSGLKIAAASCGDDAVVLGAAALAARQIKG